MQFTLVWVPERWTRSSAAARLPQTVGLQTATAESLVARLEQSEAQMRLVTDSLPVLISFVRLEEGHYIYAYVNQG